jgi:hypothetical protein
MPRSAIRGVMPRCRSARRVDPKWYPLSGCSLAGTARRRRTMQRPGKSDILDAQAAAQLLREEREQLPTVQPETVEAASIQLWSRLRDDLVTDMTRVRNRLQQPRIHHRASSAATAPTASPSSPAAVASAVSNPSSSSAAAPSPASSPAVAAVRGGGRPTIGIGSTNFSEQYILGELYGQVLEAKASPSSAVQSGHP